METSSFALPSPPPLRLRTSPNDLDGTQCTGCDELHASSDPCKKHKRIPPSPPSHATIPSSDFSSYTSQIWPNTASSPSSTSSPRSTSSLHSSWPVDSDSEGHSSRSSPVATPTSSSIKVKVSKRALPSTPPALRRKISPTETSLRDIRASQQRLLRMKESDDQLRLLYERQTMEYLFGDFASLDKVGLLGG